MIFIQNKIEMFGKVIISHKKFFVNKNAKQKIVGRGLAPAEIIAKQKLYGGSFP